MVIYQRMKFLKWLKLCFSYVTITLLLRIKKLQTNQVLLILFIIDCNLTKIILSIYVFSVKEIIVSDLIKRSTDKGLTIGEYLMWTVHNLLPMDFLNLIFQVNKFV